MKSSLTSLATGAVAVALGAMFFGGTASAASPRQAQTPGPTSAAPGRIVRVAGVIQSVGSTGIVLQARNRVVTASAGPNTWVLIPQNGRCTEGQLSDLQTGRVAEVLGTSTAVTNTVTARVIAEGRCALRINRDSALERRVEAGLRALAHHVAEGTIKSIANGTIALTTANGKELTVNTTGQTVVLNNGFAGVDTLKAGDKVQVLGRLLSRSPSATTPRVAEAFAIHAESAGSKVFVGRVESVSGGSAVVRTPAQPRGVTLTLPAGNSYRQLVRDTSGLHLNAAAQSDMRAGRVILFEGKPSSDGKTITGSDIILMPEGTAPSTRP